MTPQATPVREYVSGTIAPHLIGTLGPIYPEEYESLKDKGYQLNDILGKSGIEQAMESSLRGPPAPGFWSGTPLAPSSTNMRARRLWPGIRWC